MIIIPKNLILKNIWENINFNNVNYVNYFKNYKIYKNKKLLLYTYIVILKFN